MSSMPLPTLTEAGRKSLDEHLKTVNNNDQFPAVFLGAANAKEVLYVNEMGNLDLNDPSKGKVGRDTILQLASATKLVTSVATIRLIDKGIITKADLDNPALIDKYLPEISLDKLQVLEGWTEGGEPELRPAKSPITLKRLLNHTSGITYSGSFVHKAKEVNLQKWYDDNGKRFVMAPGATLNDLIGPLAYEPGTAWGYSPGTDFAGTLIERATGKTLEEYMQEEIFQPLGLGLTFYPPEGQELKKKMTVGDWDEERQEWKKQRFMGWYRAMKKEEMKFFAGGGGLWGTSYDYLRFIQAVLQCAPNSPVQPQHRLLSPDLFQLLFQPSIERKEENAEIFEYLKLSAEHEKYLYNPKPDNVNHSVGLLISGEDSGHGRKKGSGTWCGALKTMMWLDPASGIVGVCCSNIMVPNDGPFLSVYNQYERKLYDALA